MNRPSDRAIAQAFWEACDEVGFVPLSPERETIGWIRRRARDLDATAAPVVVGEDAMDARRYRFLRNAEWGELFYWHDESHHKHNPISKSASEHLDAAIDQALAAALAGD